MHSQEVDSYPWKTYTGEGYVIVPAGPGPVQAGVIVTVSFIAPVDDTSIKKVWLDALRLTPVTV
jgi:hypothetical protein